MIRDRDYTTSAPSSSEVNAIISGIGTGNSTHSYYSRAFPRLIFKDSNVGTRNCHEREREVVLHLAQGGPPQHFLDCSWVFVFNSWSEYKICTRICIKGSNYLLLKWHCKYVLNTRVWLYCLSTKYCWNCSILCSKWSHILFESSYFAFCIGNIYQTHKLVLTISYYVKI